MPKPNILFITYDQQRYDCVSMSGIYPVKTPNLERIANNGVFFENCYTPIPVCAPARQALMTGKRPESFGGLWNPHIVFPVKMIPDDAYSWTRSVKESGYNTAFIGSWEADDRHSPDWYGYDKFISRGSINAEISAKYPNVQYKNGFFGESNPIPLDDSYTHMTAKHTIETMREFAAADKPWYIHIDSPEPHLPCRPSAPFDTMYNPDEVPMWGGFDEKFDGTPYIRKQQLINWELENRGWDEWKHTVAYYYGIISQYDDAVGRILDALDECGQTENTIIIYSTDHGDMCGDHRLIDKHYNLYQCLCHIPFAVRWDGHIMPSRYTGYMHSYLDIQPTLMSLLDIKVPDGELTQGKDLSELLLSGQTTDGRDYAVSTYNGQQFGLFTERGICDGEYKYVWNLTDTDELYDLEGDPYELHNLVRGGEVPDEHKEALTALRKKLYDELERCKDPIIGWTKNQLLTGRKL